MKKKNIGVIFGTFVLVAVISGAFTFFMLSYKQQEKKVEQLVNQAMKEEQEEQEEKPIMSMKEILDQVDEAYVESYLGANNIVEINDKNLGMLIAHLKSLDLKLLMKADKLVEDIEEYNKCLYAIHIKNKNIKIKVNEKYVIVEEGQGGTQFFEGDPDQLKDLNQEIETVYMGKYNAFELFKNPKMLWIEAKDEDEKWILDEKAMEELLQNIVLLSPVDEKEMIGVPMAYPDYDINIETDEKNYKIHLLNEEVLSLDTSDTSAYYQYDKKLWKYIHQKYIVKSTNDSGDFKYLLKASKIIVEDIEDRSSFEDDSYYNLQISRWIIQANKEESREVPNPNTLKYRMKFTIDGEIVEVNIYKNYIEYKGKIYYSDKIWESIKSGLDV